MKKTNGWETKKHGVFIGYFGIFWLLYIQFHLKEWYIRVILAGDHI